MVLIIEANIKSVIFLVKLKRFKHIVEKGLILYIDESLKEKEDLLIM